MDSPDLEEIEDIRLLKISVIKFSKRSASSAQSSHLCQWKLIHPNFLLLTYAVVVHELSECDNPVSHLSIPLFHEFTVHFFFGSSSTEYIRMFAAVIESRNVHKCDSSVLVHIQLVVCLLNPSLSVGIDLSSQEA